MSTTPVQFCLMLAIAVEMSGATWLVGSCAGAKLRRKALSEDTPIERMRSLFEPAHQSRWSLAPWRSHSAMWDG